MLEIHQRRVEQIKTILLEENIESGWETFNEIIMKAAIKLCGTVRYI